MDHPQALAAVAMMENPYLAVLLPEAKFIHNQQLWMCRLPLRRLHQALASCITRTQTERTNATRKPSHQIPTPHILAIQIRFIRPRHLYQIPTCSNLLRTVIITALKCLLYAWTLPILECRRHPPALHL